MKGLLRRIMRRSVDRAVQMQPRRVDRIRNDLLYAAPSERDLVAEIRRAAERLLAAGLAPATLGAVAVRRSDKSATRTAVGADLGCIDNRALDTVPIDDSDPLVAALAFHEAAAWGLPPMLLALAEQHRVPEPVVASMSEAAGSIRLGVATEPLPEGVTVIRGMGVLAVGDDVGTAVTRLEAAEFLATITVHMSDRSWTDG
ncbi:MAG: hypothetical protein GWP04_01625 [Gammaproteobacteria bacterium]|nr:hypothetical protein [Gammaproteobacteria bacterium]